MPISVLYVIPLLIIIMVNVMINYVLAMKFYQQILLYIMDLIMNKKFVPVMKNLFMYPNTKSVLLVEQVVNSVLQKDNVRYVNLDTILNMRITPQEMKMRLLLMNVLLKLHKVMFQKVMMLLNSKNQLFQLKNQDLQIFKNSQDH